MIGALAGGIKTNEASTTLIMIDNRSGVQLAAAEGTAKNTDFALFGASLRLGWRRRRRGGYSSTPEGKIIIAAFADSYNQLVKVVRNYRAQTVKGGLGTGGALGVQGGTTPPRPSRRLDELRQPAARLPMAAPLRCAWASAAPRHAARKGDLEPHCARLRSRHARRRGALVDRRSAVQPSDLASGVRPWRDCRACTAALKKLAAAPNAPAIKGVFPCV